MHEVSSKDGSNIDELVESIGGVIARSGVDRGSVSAHSDAPKGTAAPSIRQQPAPPSISPSVPVLALPAQSHAVRPDTETAAGDVQRLNRQQRETQLAIEQQQAVVENAKAAAAENDATSFSDTSDTALQRLNEALAPAARQFGTEHRGGCMLCCGTATSGKEHILDLGASGKFPGAFAFSSNARLDVCAVLS